MTQPQPLESTLGESLAFMRERARDALETNDNDTDAATASLVDSLLADDEAWSLAVEAVTEAACRHFVRHVRPELRTALLATPQTEEERQAAGDATTRRLQTAAKANMYHWPLSGGGWLGDATRADVAEEQAGYEGRAASNAARARMFERIHGAMKDKGTVRQQIPEDDLRTIAIQKGVKS